MTPESMTAFDIRRATDRDARAIRSCVHAAYRHYIERIGKPPGPMLDDYERVIAERDVFVVGERNNIHGLLVLMKKEDGLLLDNIAVDPTMQGRGLGKRLMAFAEEEARRQGYDRLSLYTHELMTKNIAIYTKLGYVETERRIEAGYRRVYMCKALSIGIQAGIGCR